jgi:TRAP transporter 4TM/12TM fusion protein
VQDKLIEEYRYRTLTGFWKWLTIIFTIIGLGLSIYQIFHIRTFGMLMGNSYLYILMAFFLSLTFLFFPLKKGGGKGIIFYFDVCLWALTLFISSCFAFHGYDIIYKGWGYHAPFHITIMAFIFWALVLESVRRTSGNMLTIIILVFSIYPLFAPYMPGFMEGYGRSLTTTAVFHVLSTESIVGIPLRVFGSILIGFLVFGIALQSSGGSVFFLNLSSSLLGSTRGGTAKVAVLSSALFGSLSGSVISNVVTTGSITIPAIKKSGYPSHYAGGIECAASTGGTLMPPVMGTTAFVMAAFLDMPYANVALAAAVPSILVYLGLLIQVDGYAARKGFKGLPKNEIPSLIKTLREGWFYLFAVIVLLYFLFVSRVETQAPFYTILFLFAAAMLKKETRLTAHSFLQFILKSGRLLSELISIIAAVGMILGALALTGVAASFAREIVSMAGGNMILMIIFGALASFILGMGMTITACYIFLALVLAPALVMMGLNEISVHLFLLYWGMLSFITPPVALAAYPAAVLAESKPLKVAMTATKLGAAKYVVPLFFILDPALVLQAGIGDIFQAFVSAFIGVILMTSVLENYLIGIGSIELNTIPGLISGSGLFVAGFIVGLPGLKMDILGLCLLNASLAFIFLIRSVRKWVR